METKRGKYQLQVTSPAPEVDTVVACKGELLFYGSPVTTWGSIQESPGAKYSMFLLNPGEYEVFAVPYVLSRDKFIKRDTPFVITLTIDQETKCYRGTTQATLSIVRLGEIKNGQFVRFMMGHMIDPLEWYETQIPKLAYKGE